MMSELKNGATASDKHSSNSTYLDLIEDSDGDHSNDSSKRSISYKSDNSVIQSTGSPLASNISANFLKKRKVQKKKMKLMKSKISVKTRGSSTLRKMISTVSNVSSGSISPFVTGRYSARTSRNSLNRRSKSQISTDSSQGMAQARSGLVKAKKSKIRVEEKIQEAWEKCKLFNDILHSHDSLSKLSSESDLGQEEEERIVERINLMETFKYMVDINDLSETSLPSVERMELEPIKNYGVREHLASLQKSEEPKDTTDTEFFEETARSFKSSAYSTDIPLSSLDIEIESDDNIFAERKISFKEKDDDSDDVNRVLMSNILVRKSQVEFIENVRTEAQYLRRNAIDICDSFLTDLLNQVVQHCELESVQLQRLLDKYKMLEALVPLVEQLFEERFLKEKLERFTTEYMLRKKQFVFIKIPKQFDSLNYQRYREGLIELDRQLNIQKNTIIKTQNLTSQLRETLQERLLYVDQKSYDFEQTVRETLLFNQSFTRLDNMVESVLKNMHLVRNELSELRREIFKTQHRYSELLNRSERLDDLGNGLRMREYLTQQTETEVLVSKIEERGNEMNRLYMKINFDIHALAHLKCKGQMNLRTYNHMKAKLKKCEESKRHYRHMIYQGKLTHNKIKREQNKIKNSGSLIHYSALLIDYDETVKELDKKNESVKRLRLEQHRLILRIHQAEALLEAARLKASTSGRLSRKYSFA